MTREVLILHGKEEDAHAARLADAIRGFGYEAWHTGDVLVGEHVATEVSKRLSKGGPIVICGTMRAAGSKWVRTILSAVQTPGGIVSIRVFPVRLEQDACLEQLGFNAAIAECDPDFESGIAGLRSSLCKHFPIEPRQQDTPRGGINVESTQKFSFNDWLTNVAEYSQRLLEQYRKLLRPDIRGQLHDGLSDHEFLIRANLMQSGRLFATGVLLFNDNPQILVPKAFVQCVRYRGTTKRDLQTSKEIRGSLISQIIDSLLFIESEIEKVETLRPGSPTADFDYQYPMVCLRELVANAVCHRSYSDKKRHSTVRVLSDKIEIVSPGAWASARIEIGVIYSIRDLQSEHVTRNGRLADALRWVKLVETEGSGIPNAIADCEEKNSPIPTAENRNGLIVITVFPRKNWNRENIARRPVAFGLTEAAAGPHSPPEIPVAQIVTRRYAASQLDKHAPRVLFGRETELAALDAAWANGALNIYTLVAWGGAGKTSLVFHWVQTRFAAQGWPSVERYFDWSFYSQGTGESRQNSADLFIAKALAFFGDPDPTKGSAHERGERLAGLIRQHRTLLILDGIEPLQYPPNDPQAGRLKDQALEALLRELAADNPGLVVITTREQLTNVEGYATAEERKLDKLGKEAAVALLRDLEIVGTDEELHAAWQDAGGHALTLSLLGRFIADAFDDRDIRHYREVKFEAADQEHQGRSAFKVMIAYERWLQSGGPQRQRELAVLRLTGLFDRPMARRCLQALRAEPAIPGLTDALVTLTEQQWNIAVTRLSEVELLSVSPDAIDAHPMIREYFAAQLKRDQPAAFQAAHSRLFDDLCENTPYRPDGIDGLAPLYEAVTHGCLAGRHQEACEKVYIDRINRGTGSDGFYSTSKLGAIGADLAAVAAFFDAPWSQVSPNLTEAAQAWLLNAAAFCLRALGRLTEALQPMRAGLEMRARQKVWNSAANIASNLSELEVTLGRLPDAVTDARQSITHADQSGDTFPRMVNRVTAADALHQSGQRADAGTLFAEAERMQQDMQPQFDLLYSLQGFRYCDWLLAPADQAAWQQLLNQPISNSKSQISDGLADVERRASTTLQWAIDNRLSLLTIALDHLTLARVGLIRAILANPLPQPTLDLPHVAAAINGLRAAGHIDYLPRGLLTTALYHFVRGEHDLALKHLTEAQQIAERGPMPLFRADIHLHRARMFRDKAELAQAATLIHDLGYVRRYEELTDAEAALGTNRPRK